MSLYEYFDSSNDEEVKNARYFWNFIFDKYPKAHQEIFLNDFRSKKDTTHIASCFELYIFWIFYRLGYKIKIHPENICTKTNEKPDFLIEKDDNKLIVEAKCVFARAQSVVSEKLKLQIINAINKSIKSDKLSCSISFDKKIKLQPDIKKIIRSLRYFITELEEKTIYEVPSQFRKNTFDFKEFSIILRPKIKSTIDIKLNRNFCKFYSSAMAHLDLSDKKLLKGLKAKANKDYKNHKYPIILAFNIDTMINNDEIFMNALFGKEIVTMKH